MRRLTSSILAVGLLVGVLAAAPASADPARKISFTRWDAPAVLAGLPPGVDRAAWTSSWVEPGFALTRLIASWSARTPGNSRVVVEVRGRKGSTTSSWDTLAIWANGDQHVKRTTRSGQADDLGSVNVDTWMVAGGVTSYQLRVTMRRAAGQKASPRVDMVGAMASLLPSVDDVKTSRPGVASVPGGTVLDVPRYSQMIHTGHFPEYGAGGEAWCSPTSTSMVLGYYDALPKPKAYRWVGPGHTDPWVDHAARMVYDHEYDGAGNWPFNTAYANTLIGPGGTAFVTRLRSLREAERFIKKGIPIVASIAFGAGELTGAPISSSNGHLLVIVGFTESGDVVVNDPAAANRSGVRRTYDRGELEDAWLPASGGTVYVIADAEHPLPRSPGNW